MQEHGVVHTGPNGAVAKSSRGGVVDIAAWALIWGPPIGVVEIHLGANVLWCGFFGGPEGANVLNVLTCRKWAT